MNQTFSNKELVSVGLLAFCLSSRYEQNQLRFRFHF
jgi:hypothetical protein